MRAKLIAVALCAVGCAAEHAAPSTCLNCDDDDGKADGTDPSTTTGFLTLDSPVDDTPDVHLILRKLSSTHEHALSNHQRVELSAGTYCLHSRIVDFDTQADCTIAVAEGSDVTYYMGGLALQHPAEVFGIDTTPTAATGVANFLGHVANVSHVPGTFTYKFGTPAYTSVDVLALPGVINQVDATATGARTAIRLLPPASRELPSAHPPLQICAGLGTTAYCEPYFVSSTPVVFFATGAGESVRYQVQHTDVARVDYTSSTTVDIRLRRIDLNHVRVTTSSGLQIVPGTAAIELFDGVVFQPFVAAQPTGFGLDVPPGTYRVTTSFTNPVDNEPSSVSEVLDLR